MELSEVIRRIDDKWVLFDKDGETRLGEFDTEPEAKAREAEIIAAVAAQESDAAAVQEGHGVPNVADCLTACMNRSLTLEAGSCLEDGRVDRDEHKALSGMIGNVLGWFSAEMDAQLPDLRTRPRRVEQRGEPIPVYASAATVEPINGTSSTAAGKTVPIDESRQLETRSLSDTWDRTLTEAKIDKDGNLSGVIVVEGLSSNKNDYTEQALESGRQIFANKSIFLNHPTRTEMRERPERKEEDRVGRLPDAEHIFVEALDNGRKALKFTNGKLSKTADWLATKIREGISGAMSINASGTGREQDGRFIVEAFTDATSLDFVTEAAAGGKAFVESHRSPIENSPTDLSELTFESLVEARPDIVNDIASRERRKAYGEKRELGNLREVHKMSKTQTQELAQRVDALETHNRQLEKDKREMAANSLVQEALDGQTPQIQQRVRQLVETPLRAFIEQEELPPGAEAPGDLAPVDPEASPGDPPKLELPPDAAELPEDAQVIFLGTYGDHLAEGEEMAVRRAWSAVLAAGWVKQDGGWTLLAPEEVADAVADVAPESQPGEPMSQEGLGEALAKAVKDERAYLASVTGAGNINGMGATKTGDQAPDAKQTRAALVESFMDGGMGEHDAKIAAAGRPARQGV